MSEIFVAYASQDKERVAPLAQALADIGWSVWWDPQIPPGKPYDVAIQKALDAAKAVVCVWTQSSVESTWVRSEATQGAAREILVPVLMENVRIPLAFTLIQFADLSDWQPGQDHPAFANLINALGELTGKPGVGEIAATSAPEATIDLAVPADERRLAEIESAVAAAQVSTSEKDWEAVINVLGSLEKSAPGFGDLYPEATNLLANARKRHAAELYEVAELKYVEGRWGDVLAQFDQIRALDPDIEYGAELRARARKYEQTEMAVSYLTLRRLVGGLGVLFPTILVIGGATLENSGLPSSLSGYSYTIMQPFFVGTLIALATALFLYQGYNHVLEKDQGEILAPDGRLEEISDAVLEKLPFQPSDNFVANTAGLFALGMAAFPLSRDLPWVRSIHFLSVVALFLTLSYFSLWRFTKTKKGVPPTPEKMTRNRIYVACGITILASLVLIFILNVFLLDTAIPQIQPVLWLESAAFWAFGISWLIKGGTLFADAE